MVRTAVPASQWRRDIGVRERGSCNRSLLLRTCGVEGWVAVHGEVHRHR